MKRHNLFVLAGVILALLPIVFAHAENTRKQVDSTGLSFSVHNFAAVGDGKADDTKAFQHAVDSGRGDIYIPRGVYRLTKTVVVDLDRIGPVSIFGSGTSKIIMAGPGPAFKLVGTHAGTAAPGTVKENVWQNQRMPLSAHSAEIRSTVESTACLRARSGAEKGESAILCVLDSKPCCLNALAASAKKPLMADSSARRSASRQSMPSVIDLSFIWGLP